jgi:hypothetical protein
VGDWAFRSRLEPMRKAARIIMKHLWACSSAMTADLNTGTGTTGRDMLTCILPSYGLETTVRIDPDDPLREGFIIR